jgi:dienelactone hydrolase
MTPNKTSIMSKHIHSPVKALYAVLSIVLMCCGTHIAADEPKTDTSKEIVIREGLAIAGAGMRSRVSLPVDFLESTWVRSEWKTPTEGEEVVLQSEVKRTWSRVQAGEDGSFSGREISGVLFAKVDADEEKVWMLDVQGNSLTRVNGEPRMGDLYSNGSFEAPVLLRKGANEFAFMGARGRIKARLYLPEKSISLSLRDATFPTPVRGENEKLWGALIIVNASKETVKGLELESTGEWLENNVTQVVSLLPLSTTKVPFQVTLKPGFPIGDLKISLALKNSGSEDVINSNSFNWSVVEPGELQRRTFLSEIDGSVQYYAVRPAANWDSDVKAFDLILSLHGAGVEGQGQAACYSPKSNTVIVSPTNRRAFGFDWEDWGRMDAIEVLDLASHRFRGNRDRTYLTGHSMGGHGTWHIGSLFPSRFAAIAPSAGWISFATYAGGRPKPNDAAPDSMLARSILASDTLTRLPNMVSQGIYILHGDADDNVPVDQARTMREELGKFHPDFVYKEQPGAGHWWGNECVDWPPLVQFLRDHSRPTWSQTNKIIFVTPNPGISSQYAWATIHAQQKSGQLSRIDLNLDRATQSISGTTSNVEHLLLNVNHLEAVDGKPDVLTIDFDGHKLESIPRPADGKLWLKRNAEMWEVTEEPTRSTKGPHRNGPFKEAFQKRFMLVYGTGGTPEVNAWMLAKARFDTESFRYRGNASVEVVSDTEWNAESSLGRNVVVYGNADCNSVWKSLLSDSPIQVSNNRLTAADLNAKDESLIALFIRPRPNSDNNLVAAIGGTDLTAMRATTRLPIFSSGTGYPDALIVSPVFLSQGTQAVRLVGYFGNDWTMESGDWARP